MRGIVRLAGLLFMLGFFLASGLTLSLAQEQEAETNTENKTEIVNEGPSLWHRFKEFVGIGEADRILQASHAKSEIILGSADAPITMVEYSSLTCPHCAAFHTQVLPDIKKDYIEKGLVRLVYRHFPFDPQGTAAAMLAQCVPPAQRAGFLDVLFVRQNRWATSRDPSGQLQAYARSIGVSADKSLACWRDEELLAEIRAIQRAGLDKLNITSTPTFFINGDKYQGHRSYEDFQDILNDYLPDDYLPDETASADK